MPLTVGGGVRTRRGHPRAAARRRRQGLDQHRRRARTRLRARGGGEVRRPVHRRRDRRQAGLGAGRAGALGDLHPWRPQRRPASTRSPSRSEVAALGAGELLVTSMDRDGTKAGYDLALTRAIADAVPVPVIASGGVGDARPSRRRRARRPCQRGARRLDLPFRRALDRRGEGAHGPRRACAMRLDPAARPDRSPAALTGAADEAACPPSPSPTSPASSPSAPPRPPSESYTAKLLADGPGARRQEARRGGGRGGDRRRRRATAPPWSPRRPTCSTISSSCSRARDVPLEDGDGRAGAPHGPIGPRREGRRGRAEREQARMLQRLETPPPIADDDLSPYRVFSREEWARLRADTPLTLTADEVMRLQSLNDPISLDEVDRDLPAAVAPALALRRGDAGAVQGDAALPPRRERGQGALHHRRRRLGRGRQVDHRARAEGAARPLAEHAEGRPRHHRRLPAAERRADAARPDGAQGLSRRATTPARSCASSPTSRPASATCRRRVYSHLVYDVVPGEETVVDRPDILIVEGLNVLQPARLPRDGTAIPFVSDYLRLLGLSRRRRGRPAPLVRQPLPAAAPDRLPRPALLLPQIRRARRRTEAIAIADGLWTRINLVNLRENIVPTRQRASLILTKGASHRIEEVALRRL